MLYPSLTLTALLLPLTLLGPGEAEAQFAVGVYGGLAETMNSDVRLVQPGGTDLTFGAVAWSGESLKSPIYYGLRLTYWFGSRGAWGLALDFTHAKMYAQLEETVAISGTRDGAPASGSEPLGDTFDALSFSHGHNWLTVNALYRWFPKGGRDSSPLGRLQPYAGLGAGVAVPHVETSIAGVVTDDYQLAGPAFQGLIGLNVDVVSHLSIFLEYKLSHARINGELTDGGTLSTNPWSHNVIFGAAFAFGRTAS
jgi:opacity protein-like surface antigen